MSLKYAASGDCFLKINPWSSSHNSKTLASDLPSEIISLLCIREDVCALRPSPHRAAKHCKVLQHTLQNIKFFVQKMDKNFLASRYLSMDHALCRPTFRSNLFDPSNETRRLSSHGSHSVCTLYQHKMTNSVFLKCNHSKT